MKTAAPAVRRPAEVLRDLPTDSIIEKCLLSSILRRPDLLRDDSFPFTVGLFHLEAHKKIARAMVELDADGIQPDPVTISDRMKEPAAHSYLEDLYDVTASPANARHYANKLQEVAVRRRAIFDADKLIRAANSGVTEDIARVIAQIAVRKGEDAEKCGIDAAALIPAQPREHIVKDWIPRGIAVALHGPPGTGKSVFLTQLAVSVVRGESFYGLSTIQGGSVMYVSNEWTDREEISRIWYSKTRKIPAGRLVLEPSSPILEWVQTEKEGKKKEEWSWTGTGRCLLKKIEKMRPDLIVLDTLLGLCSGIEQLNNAMTYALGDLLQKQIASRFSAALVAVAHTSQASSKESLEQRLNYESMAGGNGLPGAIRMTIGLTKVRPKDLGKDVQDLTRSLVAVGSSKFNVAGFAPVWTDRTPGFFAWGQTGLELDSNPLSAIITKDSAQKTENQKTENGRKKNGMGEPDQQHEQGEQNETPKTWNPFE